MSDQLAQLVRAEADAAIGTGSIPTDPGGAVFFIVNSEWGGNSVLRHVCQKRVPSTFCGPFWSGQVRNLDQCLLGFYRMAQFTVFTYQTSQLTWLLQCAGDAIVTSSIPTDPGGIGFFIVNSEWGFPVNAILFFGLDILLSCSETIPQFKCLAQLVKLQNMRLPCRQCGFDSL